MTTPGMPHTPAERPEPDGYCTDCDVLTTEINGQPWHTAPRKFDEYWLECRDFGPLSSDIRTYAEACTQGDLGTPHPPAQPGAGATDTAGTEPDRGTGEREPHARSETAGLTPIQLITRPLVLAWGTRHNRDHVREIAEHIDAELRPVHYREAAGSIRAIAEDPAWAWSAAHSEGMRHAAELLDSVARDLEDGDG